MQIPLVDLQAQLQSIKPKIMAIIEDASQAHGSLPMYPELTEAQMHRVVNTVKKRIALGIAHMYLHA